MKIKTMMGNKIAVESVAKVRKKTQNAFLTMPDDDFSTGIVKKVGSDYKGPLEPNHVVCFGDKRVKVKISGEDIWMMDPDNIFAILEEENEKKENK